MKIAVLYSPIAFGAHRAPLTWGDLESHPAGLTGTDLVAVSYARELAARGHDVKMYCHNAAPTKYDGVMVRDYRHWPEHAKDLEWDVALSISHPDPLMHASEGTLRVVNRQVAGFGIDCFEHETYGFDKFVDLYTCPSETAKLIVSSKMPHPEKFKVLPNGCYPEQFPPDAWAIKLPGSVAYCSSPDRGLHYLLAVWPEIRKRVPHATLRVYYQSVDSWLNHHCNPAKPKGSAIDEECTRRALYIRNAFRVLADHGVSKVGTGLSHRELAKELSATQVLAYPLAPLAFTETFGVAALEACASGCVVVTSDADCFGEVHGHAAAIVPDPVKDHLRQFTDYVVRGLTEPEFQRSMAALGREHAEAHAWPVLAKRLDSMLNDAMAEKRLAAIGVKANSGIRVEAPKEKRLRIDLVLTPYASGSEPIDVDHPFDSNGGGGCRSGFMGLVRELPKLGYQVRAYSTFREQKEVGGVEYLPVETFVPGHERDVLLAYYDTSPLVGVTGCLRIASHHTFNLPCPGAIEWTDVNVAPSWYTCTKLRDVYDGCAPWYEMPNAVQPVLPRWTPVSGRCVWHTSPSRGLHHVLEAWPAIKKHVPHASLHIIGDVAGWLGHYDGKKDRQAERADRVRQALVRLGTIQGDPGVRVLGKLSRADVLRELSQAACFPFTFDAVAPCETFSVSMMECLAIGIPVVVHLGDALKSIYDSGRPVVLPISSLEPGEIIDEIVHAIHVERQVDDGAHRREFARAFTFERKAKALDRAIKENLPEHLRPPVKRVIMSKSLEAAQ